MGRLAGILHRTFHEAIFNGGQDAESVAVLGAGGTVISYGGLRRQIVSLVGTLEGRGLGRSKRVALAMPNGPGMAVALVSMMAGFTCAPINPDLGETELEERLTDMKADCIVTQAGYRPSITAVARAIGAELIELEGNGSGGITDERGAGGAALGDRVWTGEDDIVLLLQTSGTTAKPKLVGLTNRNIVHSVMTIKDWLGLTSGDRCLNMMPLFHVHGQITVLASLAAGGSVVCTPGFDPGKFLAWLMEFEPTWYSAVPTVHRAVCDIAKPELVKAKGRLRFIRSASSPLPVRLSKELEDDFGVPVIEAYGMTEASHGITSNPLPPYIRKAGSVGLPLAGVEVAVMGEGGEILGEGEEGEIIIRGVSVICGYLNDPEADARSFVKGWLRTGDLGYKDDDGYLFLTGRIKDLINRGGEKVAPREVEEALLSNRAVLQAIVFPLPHPTLGEDVAAAVVLKEGASVGEEALRFQLSRALAQHKVPNRIFIIDEIPKSPTGKPNRGGVMELISASATVWESAQGPDLTDTERKILDIWKEVLRRDKIGRNERFLEAGGDSLRVTMVASRLEAEFGIQLEVGTLFEADTIPGQARLVESRLSGKG